MRFDPGREGTSACGRAAAVSIPLGAPPRHHRTASVLRPRNSMSVRHPERLGREHRLLDSRDFAAVKAGATAFRGRAALLLVLPRPGEATRVGFVASKRGVGGAVQRNRARRRLREIVRRRWARMAPEGYWMMFIASRAALDAPHESLVADVEGLLAGAGILATAAQAGRP
jgi:ribonuclease P protein component